MPASTPPRASWRPYVEPDRRCLLGRRARSRRRSLRGAAPVRWRRSPRPTVAGHAFSAAAVRLRRCFAPAIVEMFSHRRRPTPRRCRDRRAFAAAPIVARCPRHEQIRSLHLRFRHRRASRPAASPQSAAGGIAAEDRCRHGIRQGVQEWSASHGFDLRARCGPSWCTANGSASDAAARLSRRATSAAVNILSGPPSRQSGTSRSTACGSRCPIRRPCRRDPLRRSPPCFDGHMRFMPPLPCQYARLRSAERARKPCARSLASTSSNRWPAAGHYRDALPWPAPTAGRWRRRPLVVCSPHTARRHAAEPPAWRALRTACARASPRGRRTLGRAVRVLEARRGRHRGTSAPRMTLSLQAVPVRMSACCPARAHSAPRLPTFAAHVSTFEDRTHRAPHAS